VSVAVTDRPLAPVLVFRANDGRWVSYCRVCRNQTSRARYQHTAVTNGRAHLAVHHPHARRP